MPAGPDLDRLLRELPAPRAPRSLLPRVMQAIALARRPWYSREWLTWPRTWQTASVILLGLVATAALLVSRGWIGGDPAVAGTAGATIADWAAAVLHTANAVAAIVDVVCRVLLQPAFVAAFVALVAISVTCAALWSVVTRVALGGASHS